MSTASGARAGPGAHGTAITICAPHEEKYLGFIEELIGREVPRAEPVDKPKPARRTKPEPEPTAAEPRVETPNEDTKPKQPRQQRDTGGAREDRGRGRRRRDDHNDSRVVGMGDHVPAFLMRPVRPTAAVVKASDDKDQPEPGATDADDATGDSATEAA